VLSVVVDDVGATVVVDVVVVVVVDDGGLLPPPPGCVIGAVPSGGLLPPCVGVVVVVFDALVVLVFGLDELLDAELELVSPPGVGLPLLSVVGVDPPNCCDAGSTFWCWDWAGELCAAAIVATEAKAVATTTPAAAIITLADCRDAPVRFGGLTSARSGSLTPPPSSAA
jgi:hypothetical protein